MTLPPSFRTIARQYSGSLLRLSTRERAASSESSLMSAKQFTSDSLRYSKTSSASSKTNVLRISLSVSINRISNLRNVDRVNIIGARPNRTKREKT